MLRAYTTRLQKPLELTEYVLEFFYLLLNTHYIKLQKIYYFANGNYTAVIIIIIKICIYYLAINKLHDHKNKTKNIYTYIRTVPIS